MPTRRRRFAASIVVIASPLLLACGSDEAAEAPSEPARTIEIRATEYAFNGDPGVINAGDTIERRAPEGIETGRPVLVGCYSSEVGIGHSVLAYGLGPSPETLGDYGINLYIYDPSFPGQTDASAGFETPSTGRSAMKLPIRVPSTRRRPSGVGMS